MDPRSEPQPVYSASEWSVEVADVKDATRIRRAFRDYLLRYAARESDVPGAELIFGELLGNVVRYADGPASFAVDWHDPLPSLIVTDNGPGFDEAPRGTLADPTAENGRGLELVRCFAVDLVIGNRCDGGAYVRVVLPVHRV